MTQIIKSLKYSEKSQRIALILTSIVSITSTLIFIKLSTGVKNIYNAKLDSSDSSQILVILFSVVGISIVCVSVMQWIIAIIIHSLFEARQKFNITIRLIGGSTKLLKTIYLKELLSIQPLIIITGIILAQICWYFINLKPNISNSYISVWQILLGILVHLTVVFITTSHTIKKLCGFNLNGQNDLSEKHIETKKIPVKFIIKFISGLAVIFVAHSFFKNSNAFTIFIFDSIGFVLAIDCLLLLLSQFYIYIGKLFNIYWFTISQMNFLYNYKKFKRVITVVFLGVMLCVGLKSWSDTTKEDMFQYSLKNIHYSDSLEYCDFIDENSVKKILDKYNIKYSTGIYLLGQESNNEQFYLKTIDNKTTLLETIKTDHNISDISLSDIISGNNNKIILPQSYITKKDIGKELNINWGNYKFNFVISGGCYYNDASTWYTGLVNKSYLQSILKKEQKINIIYLSKLNNQMLRELKNIDGVSIKKHLSALDIAANSKSKAVQSLIIIFIPIVVVFICSIVMMSSIFVINKKQNILDITKLKGIGAKSNQIMNIYIFMILDVIFKGFLFGLIFAFKFSRAFLEAAIGKEYMLAKTICPYNIIFLLLFSISVISITTFILTVKNVIYKDFINILREE